MQAQEKRPGFSIETRPDVRDQPVAGFEKIVEADPHLRHALELFRIGLVEVNEVRAQQFMRRTGRAGDVDQEGPEQILCQTFLLIEQPDVIEVTRMLTVHSRVQLAAEQVFEGNDLHLRITEFILHRIRHRAHLGIVDDATHDR